MKVNEFQDLCYELVIFLNENYFGVIDSNANRILSTINDFLFSRIKDEEKVVFDNFYSVIEYFLSGKLSENVLLFYFKMQFKLESNDDINLFLANLKMHRTIGDNELILFIEQPPKISVIITTFNRRKYLEEAIYGILNQNYPNIEIIVIDDASTDDTDFFMKNTFLDKTNIRYIKKDENTGPGNNRREAFLTYGDGEYILFLDDDDYLIDSNYLSQAVSFHIKHPEVSFVAANVFIDHVNKNQFKISDLHLNEIMNKNDYFLGLGEKDYPKPTSTLTTLFKRNSLIKMNITDMNMVNDASIYLRSLLVGDAGFIDLIVGVYRIHGNNITFNLSKEFIIENLEEKIAIKKIAINDYGYKKEDMDYWVNNNIYKTIEYYFIHSAKNSNDFQYMYNWAKMNCPEIYKRLKKSFRIKAFKKKIIKITLFRWLFAK